MFERRREHLRESGVALVAVLWLTVALSLMALTTSYLVRTEASALSNRIDSERGYWLARGGVQAAIRSIQRQAATITQPELISADALQPGQRWIRYQFSQGTAVVEVVPENAKLNVNQASAEQLAALAAELGLSLAEAQDLAAAIVHWRTPRTSAISDALDLFYEGLPRPYSARHAAIEDLEELLSVKGVTPELFFGGMQSSRNGKVYVAPPLSELLTTDQTAGGININYARPEILRLLPGWSEDVVLAVVAARERAPFHSLDELTTAVPETASLTSVSPITLSGAQAYTLTASGVLADSRISRTVRARVRFGPNLPMGYQIVAWWSDWPWSHQTLNGNESGA